MSLTDDEIYNRVKSIFIEEFELEEDQLVPEATLFDDLGLDSVLSQKSNPVKITTYFLDTTIYPRNRLQQYGQNPTTQRLRAFS